MYLDGLLKFADAQTDTESAASTNVVDTLAKGDVNASSQSGAYFYVRIDTTFVIDSGAPTAQFQLQTSAQEDFTGGADTMVQSAAFVVANLTAGTEIKMPIPTGALRYIRGYIVTTSSSTTRFTTAVYDMFIAKDVEINRKLA